MKVNKIFAAVFFVMLFSCNSCFAEINKNFKVVQCDNNINRCVVRNSSLKYGVTDKNGKQILPCVYSDIQAVEYSNYLVTTKDVKMGLANKDGVFLLKPEYLSIKKSRKEGKYLIQPDWDEVFGLADMQTGHIDIPAEYELIVPMENGAYRVVKEDKSGVMNSDFKLILPVEYYFITLLPANLYYRLHKTSGAKNVYGIADKEGKLVLPVDCSWVDKNPSSYKQRVERKGKSYIFNSQNGRLIAK